MNEDQRNTLIASALEARKRAYTPYSKFPVGAAMLAMTGEIFIGCNVENASYGLTICAERVAFTTAVAAGQQQFEALAVATSGGHAPCGACRQFAAEFCEDLLILLVDAGDESRVTEVRLRDLLPGTFSLPSS